MESTKRMVTGEGFEEKEEKEKCEGVMTSDNSSTEETRNG